MPKLVLIVDDDLDLRESVQMLLEDAGYLTVGARDGRDALDLLQRADPLPDLILLDLSMPVLDGVEATRQVTGRVAGTAVVVLTAGDDPVRLHQAREAGAAAVVLKGAAPA